MNRTQNLLERSAREISSADASGKKSVSCEQLPRVARSVLLFPRSEIKRNAARGVAWRMKHTGLEAAPAKRVAFTQKFIDADRVGRTHAKPGRLNIQVAIKFHVVTVHEYRRAGGLLHLAQAADVVDMRVGAHNGFHGECMLREDLENPVGFIAGIDHQRFTRFRVAND